MKKALRAAFEDFFVSPSSEKLVEVLRSPGGEYNNLDYKADWPTYPKVARGILAIGNCGGGAVVIGVKQLSDGSLESLGLQNINDKADIHKGVSKLIPRAFEREWEVYDFAYKEGILAGKSFQVILVEYRPQLLPLVLEADGEGVRKAAIYVRRGTSSEEADYHELQNIINARLDTGHSSTEIMVLARHLDELGELYGRIPIHRNIGYALAEQLQWMGMENNPAYPRESYEQYVAKLIEKKKQVIDALIGRSTP